MEMEMPKIKIDRDRTTLAQVDKVKSDIEEFRNCYTVGDLIRNFVDQTETNEIWNASPLKVEIKAFPAGTGYDNETHYSVEMFLDQYETIWKIRFYCDMLLRVDTRDFDYGKKMLYTVKKFVVA